MNALRTLAIIVSTALTTSAVAYDLLAPVYPTAITAIQTQYNSTSWAAANLLDDQASTRWLSRQRDNDITFAFDGSRSVRCFSRFNLDNYGSTRSIRQFMLLHTSDAGLAADVGTVGWTPIVADVTPAGEMNHLHWGQGGRISAIDTQYNSTSWAAAHINNGNPADFWLSGRMHNTLDFDFDTDWDGSTGNTINISRFALQNYGGNRSIHLFQVEVSQDGASWQKLEVPGSGPGDPDFNFALQHEGGALTAINREYNATSWAGANIHDGASQTIWLSGVMNNNLDFAFDPDGDGITGADGDTDDRFLMEEFILENYGTTRSVREFQVLVKTAGNPSWQAIPVPGGVVGEADFNFALSHNGGSLTSIDTQYNTSSWAAANIHDGASQTIWLSGKANNTLDFAFDTDGDGVPAAVADRFTLQKIALENYGSSRSMRDFQVEVKTAAVPDWTRLTVPGSTAGDPGFNFLSRHEGGVLTGFSSQYNASSYAAANLNDGSPLSLWLSSSATNTLEYAFDTDLDGSASDAIGFSTLRMHNYGNTRSVATFEIDVQIAGGPWQPLPAPGGGTVFSAVQGSAAQEWSVTPQNNVTAFRLRTLSNFGDTYTGFRELELLGDAVGPTHTFVAAQAASEQVIALAPADQPAEVTDVRLRAINNYGDIYTGVREFRLLGDSVTRNRTFVAQQGQAEQVFTIDPADRPSGITALRLQTISNYGDTYIGVRELRLLGPAVSASHTFVATNASSRQVFSLDPEDAASDVVSARLRTINNYGDTYIGAREFELLGTPVGPSYLFDADQASTEQSWSFPPVSARLFRLHTFDNYGDTYTGAKEIGLETSAACDPLALWHLDELNWGSVLDSSGNNHAGSAANGVKTAYDFPVIAGSPGTCRHGVFDGQDDFLQFSTVPNLTESFTVAAWIRANELGGDQRIFADDGSNSGGFAFSLGDGGDGRLRFFSRAVNPVILDSPPVITPETWHFVAIVHDAVNKTRRIFVDGGLTPVAQDTYTGAWGTDSAAATVGGEPDGTAEGTPYWRFNGAIDEVMVYQRALGGGELATLKDQTHVCGALEDPSQPAFAFNCIEPGADAISGRLYTKTVGNAFVLDVAALRDSDADNMADSVETEYAQDTDRVVSVELVNTSAGGSCATYPALSPAVVLPTTFQAVDGGRRAAGPFSLSSAYRSVGCRVTDALDAPSVVGCSSDAFSVRPTALTLQPPALNNAGSAGSPAVKVGTDFSLQVAATVGYDGTPAIASAALEAHAGAVALGSLTGGFASATAASGIAEGTGFRYSEVGNFRFVANAIRDAGYTAVDQPADCLPDSVANTPDSDGRVGCDFANPTSTTWVGRFTPDHFEVGVSSAGSLGNTCTGFSYAGTALTYATDPVLTITAKAADGATTRNYTGDYNKLTTTEVTLSALTGDASTLGADGTTPIALALVSGSRDLTDNGDGSMTLTLSDDSFTYGRGLNNLVGEFVSDITRQVTSVSDSEDGTTATGLPLDLATTGVPIRYGRVNIANAHGSELQTLSVPMRLEYFAGASAGFQANVADGCTSVNSVSLLDGDGSDSLLPGDSCIWDAAASSGAFACSGAGLPAEQYDASPGSGDFNLKLMAPTGGASGVLKVSADVDPWLEFDWQGGGDSDPEGLATFGIYQGDARLIFMREVR